MARSLDTSLYPNIIHCCPPGFVGHEQLFKCSQNELRYLRSAAKEPLRRCTSLRDCGCLVYLEAKKKNRAGAFAGCRLRGRRTCFQSRAQRDPLQASVSLRTGEPDRVAATRQPRVGRPRPVGPAPSRTDEKKEKEKNVFPISRRPSSTPVAFCGSVTFLRF